MTPFALAEPSTLAEAMSLLDPDDPSSRPIAGGTALMLMMKAGFFQPSKLVSLRKIEPRYSSISFGPGGEMKAGALVRLGGLERSAEVRRAFPVLADTLRVVSNVRVRNVATIGGNLAHADPHMDLPPVLMALDAQVVATSRAGERTIPIGELLVGYYETSLAPGELISGLLVPGQDGRRCAYIKCTTRSAHDWPAVGIAVSFDAAGNTIRDPRIVVSAATVTPTRMADAETVLNGAPIGDEAFRAAGEAAAKQADVVSDVRGSAAYKKQLIRVNVARALAKALDNTDTGAAVQ
ncbi:FAD binding domain-containing protein [Rhodoligotrophos defluvii]|uniref:FAD binding domain-containing protein n=1 Tax=Rhodoligotrophos defluvii TaxID=2561934 RepID=UPI0010C9CBBA|nr:FAD binding domain-containing protein [Rhodoligotrophos defluvii]